MKTRIVRLTRFSAPACATMITAITAWAFLSSTACSERDPFQFASIMAAIAKARLAQTVAPPGDCPPAEVTVYTPPDLLAVPPPCLERCA
nr:hypothetical protein Hi04_10k_c4606_00010 [uncultured bacterium]